MKKNLILFLALALLILPCACGGAAEPSAGPSEEPAVSDGADPGAVESGGIEADLTRTLYEFAGGLPDGDAAMVVNGAVIPNEIYFYWLSSYCYYIDYNYSLYGMTADFTDEDMAAELAGAARDVVIYYAVVRSLAEQNGSGLTAEQESELQAQIDSVLQSQGYDMDTLLRSSGLSEDSFYYVNTADYLRENLKAALVGEPSEGDLAQFASDKNLFSCKHILLKTVSKDQTDTDGNVIQTAEEYNAARRALAENLLERLRAAEDREALLDQLAEEFSEDGRDGEGHLAAPEGYTFDDDDSLVGGFREGALAVEPGELTDIVETDYGYHIILRLPVDPSSFSTVYHDKWQDETLEAILNAEAERADVTASEALDAVDLADFYSRYAAWRSAFAESVSAKDAQG